MSVIITGLVAGFFTAIGWWSGTKVMETAYTQNPPAQIQKQGNEQPNK